MPSFARNTSVCFLLFFGLVAHGQKWYQSSDSLNERRAILVASVQDIAVVGSLSGLNLAWYSNYDSEKFHLFNDWDGWMQMDKAGHALSAYQVSRSVYLIDRWAGIGERTSAYLGAGMTFGYLGLVEVMDGYSAGWGFSLYDVAFNTIGVSAFLGQQLGWHEQRIKLKFSFLPSGLDQTDAFGQNFREADRAKALFGKGLHEQWLKDYNGQTYWVSANIWSLIGKPDRFPKWLNVSAGYSVDNVLGAESNRWNIAPEGLDPEYYSSSLQRQRQFLLSLDLDLDHVDLPKYLVWLKPLVGVIKVPFPTLQWNTRKGVVFNPIYF